MVYIKFPELIHGCFCPLTNILPSPQPPAVFPLLYDSSFAPHSMKPQPFLLPNAPSLF